MSDTPFATPAHANAARLIAEAVEQAIVSETLADWEARLLVKVRQLRRERARGILVLFDGPAMTMHRLTPDGRVEE